LFIVSAPEGQFIGPLCTVHGTRQLAGDLHTKYRIRTCTFDHEWQRGDDPSVDTGARAEGVGGVTTARRSSRFRLAVQTSARLLTVAVMGVRYIVPVALGPRPRRTRACTAAAACRVSQALGSTYLKFGQIIASSPGIVGEEVADAFRGCLDTGPPIRSSELFSAIERAAGRPVAEAYAHIDPVPLGTASIAVVHRGVTVDGSHVAIKVRRPGIEARVATDVRILRRLALLAIRFGKSADAAQLLDLIDDFDRNIRAELDFSRELAAMDRIGKRIAEHRLAAIVVPSTYPALSDTDVLVMELLDGTPIDDVDTIEEMQVDAGPLVDEAIRTWLVTSLIDGDFHGDCHAGNVLVLRDGRLGLIDWGIVGVLDGDGRKCMTRLLEGGLGYEAGWTDVAEYFVSVLGDSLADELGARSDELPSVLRDVLGPMLTAPFGRSSLARFLDAAKERAQAAAAIGGSAALGATRDHVQADAKRVSFSQGFFLWMKQLVFFERYARLHHRTMSIAGHASKVLRDLPGAQNRLPPATVASADIDGLHHVGLVVRNLPAAIRVYRGLGFEMSAPNYPLMPESDGELRPFGAANAYAHFAGGFLELMAAAGPDSPVPPDAETVAVAVRPELREHFREVIGRSLDAMSSCLDRFEGMHRLVLRTSQAYVTAERLSTRGIDHSGVNVTDRPVTTATGTTVERLRFLELDRERADGSLTLLEGTVGVAEPLEVPRPAHHANGVLDLAEIVLAIPDNEAHAYVDRYESYIDQRAEQRGFAWVIDVGMADLVIVPGSRVSELLPGERAPALPAFVAHGYRVVDLEETTTFLERGGIPLSKTDCGDLLVSARDAAGAAILFRSVGPSDDGVVSGVAQVSAAS
jgi:predicted unusual protein kinase regulating ubiquinone biosynthesis (AarF/ABC1/UbiB family)/catechol 2,3-dioxygenase-like lactoylglutathione lyase family enzyme